MYVPGEHDVFTDDGKQYLDRYGKGTRGLFFFNLPATTEIYTLSLHDALPISRTENILHRNFTRRQVAIQNRVASNIGISQSTFSVKVLNLFSRSRRKTNKRKSKHSAMLR